MSGADSEPRHWWTEEEHDILRRDYQKGRSKELARRLGVTPNSIRLKVRELGLTKPRHPGGPWSAAEDATLWALCGVATAAELAGKLGRSTYATERRMAILGMRRNEIVRRRTADHLKTIRDLRTLLAVALNLMPAERAAVRLGQPAATLRQVAIAAAMPAMGERE